MGEGTAVEVGGGSGVGVDHRPDDGRRLRPDGVAGHCGAILQCVVGMRPLWTFIAVVAGLVASSCATLDQPNPELDVSASAMPVPAQLSAVDGDDFEAVVAGLRGKPVVVNIWASWCGPCRVEAPLLQRAADRYAGDVTFLGVASKDDASAARDFLDRYSIRYPNLFDRSGEIRRLLGMRGFPTTYIVGRDGRVLASVVGGISDRTLAARIRDALRT